MSEKQSNSPQLSRGTSHEDVSRRTSMTLTPLSVAERPIAVGNKKDPSLALAERLAEKRPEQDEEERAYLGETEEAIERDERDSFPEGGLKAWLVVAGAVAVTFSSFGYVNAWGVFQAHYQQTLLSNVSPSSISWIGSVQYSLTFLPGVITGRLFDLGYFHVPLIISSLVLIVATFLVAECTQYWQFILGQGIALGLASGFLFGPTMAIVAQWFHKKRSRAYGIVAVGSSIGGTTLPIAVSRLLPLVGFPWTMRIIGFIMIVTMTFANLVMRRRLPPVHVAGGLLNPAAFKNLPYTLYTAACCVSFLGLYTALTYFNVEGDVIGLSPDFSVYLTSIANAASGFGRVGSGFLADRIGPVSVLIPFTLIAAATTYAWPFCTNVPSIVIVAIIYGVASGAFVGLMGAPLAAMGPIGDMGRRQGMTFSITAFFALCGPPISGAINDKYNSFHQVGFYAGSMIVGACMLLAACKWTAKGSLLAKY